MPADEQNRFMDAILKMMENVGGAPQSSPYFKLAGQLGVRAPQQHLAQLLTRFLHASCSPCCVHTRPVPPAGNHGWPDRYCSHGVEVFPAWHRAYLREFERALQVGGGGRRQGVGGPASASQAAARAFVPRHLRRRTGPWVGTAT